VIMLMLSPWCRRPWRVWRRGGCSAACCACTPATSTWPTSHRSAIPSAGTSSSMAPRIGASSRVHSNPAYHHHHQQQQQQQQQQQRFLYPSCISSSRIIVSLSLCSSSGGISPSSVRVPWLRRNRALDGDTVVVELNDVSKWGDQRAKGVTRRRTARTLADQMQGRTDRRSISLKSLQ
jgi:hypothetical protein